MTDQEGSATRVVCSDGRTVLWWSGTERETTSLAEWLRHPPQGQKTLGSKPTCARIFSGSSHTSDLKIGTPVATLPGAWRYRVSTGTGQPGVNIL